VFYKTSSIKLELENLLFYLVSPFSLVAIVPSFWFFALARALSLTQELIKTEGIFLFLKLYRTGASSPGAIGAAELLVRDESAKIKQSHIPIGTYRFFFTCWF
jgi:hypothetical protein